MPSESRAEQLSLFRALPGTTWRCASAGSDGPSVFSLALRRAVPIRFERVPLLLQWKGSEHGIATIWDTADVLIWAAQSQIIQTAAKASRLRASWRRRPHEILRFVQRGNRPRLPGASRGARPAAVHHGGRHCASRRRAAPNGSTAFLDQRMEGMRPVRWPLRRSN